MSFGSALCPGFTVILCVCLEFFTIRVSVSTAESGCSVVVMLLCNVMSLSMCSRNCFQSVCLYDVIVVYACRVCVLHAVRITRWWSEDSSDMETGLENTLRSCTMTCLCT